jgi:Zn-dependent protease
LKETADGVVLGTIFGFPLFIPTVHLGAAPILIFWTFIAGMTAGGEIADGFILLFIILGSVLSHELGHAFVARASGLHVRRIAFTWYGGYAELLGAARSRRREIAIALAGPFANLGLAAIAFGLLAILNATTPIPQAFEGRESIFWSFHEPNLLERSVRMLMWTNIGLGAFNLLPGLPLDGGHALRSALAARLSWFRAHSIAMWAGVWTGLITVAAAWTFQNLWMVLIGASITLAAWTSRTRPQLD